MSVLKKVFSRSLKVTRSFLKGNKEIELKPNSARLKKVARGVDRIVEPLQLQQTDNLNFMIREKTQVLLQCEREFDRQIPSYKLRDLKSIQDIINYFAAPIAKVYASGLPNLEESITQTKSISNIKIYEGSSPPNPEYEKKHYQRIY